eukprot:CAMPEP_0197597800 /NCGR_PEP_ID=MMETSP1326-20131121/28045_1 /TAXON_ID=1155430 /ORGANISM="Genus nov. species nov., Strain RCC2288" /LENGTH=73 /DNA_ID=CAMNT_0043164523 /DNA_START=102 /DNA_END=321 /DNA_ORIENTATION=+
MRASLELSHLNLGITATATAPAASAAFATSSASVAPPIPSGPSGRVPHPVADVVCGGRTKESFTREQLHRTTP